MMAHLNAALNDLGQHQVAVLADCLHWAEKLSRVMILAFLCIHSTILRDTRDWHEIANATEDRN